MTPKPGRAAVRAKKKRRYMIVGQVTISVHTTVDAYSLKEAYDEANRRNPMGLCHQCASGEPTVEWVTGGDLDGDPEILEGQEGIEEIDHEEE